MHYLLTIAVICAVIFVGWRLVSRRASLPCPSWLAWMVEMDNPLAKSHNAASIVGRLNLHPGMRVLDAGCGPGRVTIPLARAVGTRGEVIALDVQQQMLDRVMAKAREAGLTNILFRRAALGEAALEINQFDRAILVTVLGEIPDRRAALREIYQALRPGGLLSVTELVFDPHYQSHSSVLHAAHEAGFREKAFFGNRFAFTVHLEKAPAS